MIYSDKATGRQGGTEQGKFGQGGKRGKWH